MKKRKMHKKSTFWVSIVVIALCAYFIAQSVRNDESEDSIAAVSSVKTSQSTEVTSAPTTKTKNSITTQEGTTKATVPATSVKATTATKPALGQIVTINSPSAAAIWATTLRPTDPLMAENLAVLAVTYAPPGFFSNIFNFSGKA